MKKETEMRPWGCYKIVAANEGYQIKVITLKSKSALSLQYHHHRSEHWIVVSGEGTATLGQDEQEFKITKGSYIHVPQGEPHRLINKSESELVIAEVQLGDYLEEDDIIRIKDYYGRV